MSGQPVVAPRVLAGDPRGKPSRPPPTGVPLGGDDEDYETVAGLIMKAAGCVPKPGYTCETDGVHFEVLSSDATRLLEVAVHRQETVDSDEGSESTEDGEAG